MRLVNHETPPTNAPLILIIDEQEASNQDSREQLEAVGFRVKTAENGDEGIKAAIGSYPSLVLIHSHDQHDFDIYKKLRDQTRSPYLAIIAITPSDSIESINQAYEWGATDFITTPIHWPLLIQRIRFILRLSETITSLRNREAHLSMAQHIAHLGNWEWDPSNHQIYCSQEVYSLFGIPPHSGQHPFEDLMDAIHPQDQEMVRSKLDGATSDTHSVEMNFRVVLPNGNIRHLYAQAEAAQLLPHDLSRMFGTIQDVTERKQAEDKIRRLAFYDTLTGLPNRALFREHAQRALDRAARNKSMVATLYLDLDRFKVINDTLGHDNGDALLEIIAEQLSNSLRTSDVVARGLREEKVARLGGDEFMILLTDFTGQEVPAKVAGRILEKIARPIFIGEHELLITGSIGISFYPDDGEDVETLLKHADIAMYHAKDMGRNNYQFYSRSISVNTIERLALESKLRYAIIHKEMELYYLPRVDLDSGAVSGVEALLRWHHPDKGLIPPSDFLPLAEETGLIIPIGEWALRTACQQAKQWSDAGLGDIPISVNVSARQFSQRGLVDIVANVLETTQIKPELLELELTEQTLMQHPEVSKTVLDELKALDVKISVDNYGSGSSSLAGLKMLPLDIIKIDRPFINGITSDPMDRAIIASIITLSNNLNIKVIADGVETDAQGLELLQQGCTDAQGYFFSKPLPAKEFESELKDLLNVQ